MRELRVDGTTGRSTIAIGESLDRLLSYIGKSKAVIITDETINRLYGHRFPSAPVFEIGLGEDSKTLQTVEAIYDFFLSQEIDRSSVIIAVGGGIVCDVAGYAASTYMRGVSFGFVATTLLAQVDASVGGKNGVNLRGYKNLIGTFTQPDFVICDPELLRSLPREELVNGYAEVVKTAAIGDAALFGFLEKHSTEALALDAAVVERAVTESLAVKIAVVSQDEEEKGERRKLNFGHTIGHAIEKVYKLRHGEAVSLGMIAAARLSVSRGLLAAEVLGRLERLLGRLGLPLGMKVDGSRLLDALRKDKKRESDSIHFVLLEDVGRARVLPMTIDALEKAIDDMCQPR
jgi:3-dehydroquinate synthase